ncbi:MAG: putative lipid II flippase FtsW [Gemmatimonadetes bacterium]|nr:putative lipid II flippase FtsW [Gemmatimonadota bacterium]
MSGPARGDSAIWETRLMGVVAATLAVFGIAAVYGASSIVAVQSGQSGWAFALRQLIGVALGLFVLIVVSRVDYHFWQRLAWPLLGLTAALLLVLLLPGLRNLAPEVNGSRRWINLGVFTVQPSELAKFAVVVWTAMLATKKDDAVREFRRGVLPFLVILAPLAGLVLMEPDMSTAVEIVLLGGIVLFVAGAKIGHFLLLGLVAIPVAGHEATAVQYRLARILTFMSPGADLSESNWQITQSMIGIGAGRVFGVGFGQGLQKLGYLPYAYSDFLFSTIGEEWGFVGVGLVILLFAVYIGLGLRIARTAADRFGTLLAAGLTSLIGVTAILHMAVTMALVPTTGLTLPFLSYGRSSLLISLLATGVIINIGTNRTRGQIR